MMAPCLLLSCYIFVQHLATGDGKVNDLGVIFFVLETIDRVSIESRKLPCAHAVSCKRVTKKVAAAEGE